MSIVKGGLEKRIRPYINGVLVLHRKNGYTVLNGFIPLAIRFSMYRIAKNPQSNLPKIKNIVTNTHKFAHWKTKHRKLWMDT